MRTRLLQIVAVATLALLCVGQAADAQSPTGARGASRTAQISSQFHHARVAFSTQTGTVRMLGGSPARPLATSSQLGSPRTALGAANAFLSRNAALFGVGEASDLRLGSRQAASQGRTVLRYQQTYKSVPVVAGDVVVDVSGGNDIISVNGEAANGLSLSVRPYISPAQARQTALATVARAHGVSASTLRATSPRLWVYDARLFGPDGAYGSALAWRTEVTGGSSASMRELVMVDAQKGGVLFHFSEIEAVSPNRTVCDRNNTHKDPKLCGTTGEPVVIAANGTGYGSATTDAQRAFDYAGNTWNFYFKRFGRNSLNGAGLPLRSTVRFCYADTSVTCPLPNAFWNGQQMFYGAGFAAADDVDGHELTHGFTQFTSHLLYAYQSGAINEAMSDIMGEFVDQDFNDAFDNDSPSAKWLVGEDIPGFPNGIRNMADPALSFGIPQPDRMTSPNWYQAVNAFDDNGGVHENSGVANKAAYLLGEDATHAPIAFNGQSIQPLGRDKAAALFFEVDGHILTSGSDYADLASALKQACQNLLGTTPKAISGAPSPTGAFTAANCAQVNKVILATAMSHRAVDSPRASAPACPTAKPHRGANIFNDPVEYNAPQTTGSSFPWLIGALWSADNQNATSVNRTKQFHDFNGVDFGSSVASSANIKNGYLTLKTARHIPANAYLRFNHWYVFDNGTEYTTPTNDRFDGGRVEYSTDGGAHWLDLGPKFDSNGYDGTIFTGRGNPLAGKRAFTGQSRGYLASRANLASLAGKDVKFRFHIATDDQWSDYGWFLDDIAIYTCS
jgi:Zn-dependent metalloprotease